jgi:hypothetical protein
MRTRRILFGALLAVLVVVGLAVGNATASKPKPAPTAATNTALGPDGGNAVSYCPGLPPAVPVAQARIAIANVGRSDASLDVMVLPDKGNPTRSQLIVKANSQIVKRRADLGPPGAITMESFGGRVVVEEGLEGPTGMDFSPCALQTSTRWEFAAGTTPRGAQQWLVIDDPYASDAKVDVVLRTSAGVRRPDALQGLDIGRRSRTVIAIHDASGAVRQDRVAVEVNATVGGVVAAQTLIFNSDTGTPGVATTVGVPGPAEHWMFAEGVVPDQGTSMLAVVNVGPDDADVGVQTIVEKAQASTPVQLTLTPDNVQWVKFGGCRPGEQGCIPLPAGTRFGIDVRAEGGSQIVAQTLGRVPPVASRSGVTTSMGVREAARSWVFARSQVAGERETTLAVTNPTATQAVIDVNLVQGNTTSNPLRKIRVLPGRRITILVADPTTPRRPDAAMVVQSDVPIVVERLMVNDNDASHSVGVAAG